MRVLLIEDEQPASKRLSKLVKELEPTWEIINVIDTVEDSVDFLKGESPDLIFMDIQLADGLSLRIFEKVEVSSRVIFTTAFDHYAIEAIKLGGLDYLLKPVDKSELQTAIEKFKSIPDSPGSIEKLLEAVKGGTGQYKNRFLIKIGDQLKFVEVPDIAYFISDSGMAGVVTSNGKELPIDFTLDQLVEKLDPSKFFRINRKMIVSVGCIGQIHTYFNSRLKLELNPSPGEDVIVSRERVGAFKSWLDQ